MKISKKTLLAITLTLTTFLAMFAIMRPAVSTEFIDVTDYCWIEGVLDDDTYTLYPYAQESIDIGFSKYGELIGYDEDAEIGLGIQYPGFESAADPDDAPAGTYDQRLGTSVDPFANEKVGVDWWMRGWFIDLKYTPLGAADREIWAFAMFSDGAQHGGDWIVMPSVTSTSPARPIWQEYPPYANPDSTAYSLDPNYVGAIPASGGRKTNGHCETEDIEIIYNGPRRFIAIARTTISDVGAAAALVDLTFTFIFNKAEKNIIVLKDVKRLYVKSPMNVQFGNRGEWDLGISPDTDSYIHWYTDEPVQFWDEDGLGTITSTEEGRTFEFFKDYFLAYKHPKKWWDDVPDSEKPTEVCDEWTREMTDFPDQWLETQETCYGREWHMDGSIKEHSYAVAQVITQKGDYVGAFAVWPHPEFWAAHNLYYPPYRTTLAGGGNNPSSLTLMLRPISRMLEWNKWTVVEDPTSGDYPHGYLDDRTDVWVKSDDVVTATGATKEPIIPFTIAEHDFELSSTMPAYRIVSVYMLTDNHDGDDADAQRGTNSEDWSDGVNQIDREIQYQLDEIFDPWDIYDAMHKNTKSWVQFFNKGVAEPTTPWTSTNKKAWDGETYHCIQLDAERTVEQGLRIPSLPVYPGTEPGVRPADWTNDRGLTWDAYCAFTERVLVDSGSGYELIPRAVGGPILAEPADYKPSSLTSYNFLDPTPDTTRHYYTINFNTGRICFYEWDDVTEIFEEWYLPIGSMVKILWSSEHHATTAEQWDSENWEYSDYWKLYPIDGVTFRFPLHHDIIPAYKPLTEVLLIEQQPVRLLEGGETGAYYTATGDTITVFGVANCSEIDIKYYTYDAPQVWAEEKFHKNTTGTTSQTFTLAHTPAYIEKVWYHSEKALLGGDYVFNNATQTLYMQDPVAAGEWLLVNYTISNDNYCDFFLGDGSTTVFALHHGGTTPTAYHDVGSLNVSNTETLQQIVLYNASETALGIRVPKIKTKIWWTDASAVTDTYEYATRERFGVWEEREWINVTDTKVRGNWIVRETSTCDELVLDQAPLNTTDPPQELKIVFKVPSGRWEWGTVGKTSAAVDSLGATMVVAAFKNKLIEFGLGGLDIQDATFGPRIPSTIREAISPDSIGRYHLHDDWCYSRTGVGLASSWPISSSNIITVGGPYPNMNSKYFNEFAQAMIFCNVDGVAGADDGFYAVTCWDKALADYGFYDGGLVTDRYGYAVISTYKDKNGTIGFMVYGWTGQDTYYASKWFDEYKFWLQHINLHVTDLILKIEYKTSTGTLRCPPTVSIVEKLGTISEKPQHDC